MWEKIGYVHNEAQEANFKLARMQIQDGKLWVQTETGCFSKGGLASKYGLRGDFDIQVDCQIDFLQGVYNMDQLLTLTVVAKGQALGTGDMVFLRLSRDGGSDSSEILTEYLNQGTLCFGNSDDINNFDGTLRIVKKGSKITTLYKTKGVKEWKVLDTFWSTSNELQLGFLLENFTRKRTSITARAPITAIFDNFRINAAEGIIEEEI